MTTNNTTHDETSPPTPVTVTLQDLEQGNIPISTLESAFGPSSLGIILVSNLPAEFPLQRHRLLTYASHISRLPSSALSTLTKPEAKYLVGWSHGRELLPPKSIPDTRKGSFYVNCAFYRDAALDAAPAVKGLDWVPEYMCGNVWPDEDGDDDAGDGLPALQGFRVLMQEMCCFIIDVAALVARSVDRYAEERVDGYTAPRKDDGGVGYLESVVRGSYTTKARLLHYFPPEATAKERARSSSSSSAAATEEEGGKEGQKEEEEEDVDSWCATHLDHGCLTGLLSALYLDSTTPLPALPELPTPIPAPDPTAGLYIYSRSGTAVKVNIPPDCIAFQTGEALQKITDGKFRAVPHYVSPGTGIGTGTGTGTKNETGIEAGTGDASAKGRRGAGLMRGVERNTLAVFTQPNLQDVVDRRTGQVFGGFAAEVVSRNTVMG